MHVLCQLEMHFDTEEELEKHSRSHNKGERNYKCSYDKCSYSARTLDKLNAHHRYHSGERPFKCDFIGCHQEFIQSHHLARHRKTHFGGGDGKDDDKDDKESSDLDTIDDQIQCNHCDLSFDDESQLSLHLNSQHPVDDSQEESEESKTKDKLEAKQSVIKAEEATESPPLKVCSDN